MAISVATWNTEWRTPNSDAGRRIAAILATTGSDIIVVTEGVRGLLPEGGYIVDAGPDWGYARESFRRKVIVWSRYPLTLESIGTEGGTRGRLVVATAALPAGPVRIVGVCIPWRDAHVKTGRGDAQPWSEHLDHLDQLEELLAGFGDTVPIVIAGDFNQRIPRGRQPVRVAERLNEVFSGWTIHTAGALPNGPHIDHIATNRRLVLHSVRDWPASDHLGRLSDHAGVVCRLLFTDDSHEGLKGSSSPSQVLEEQEPDVVTLDDLVVLEDGDDVVTLHHPVDCDDIVAPAGTPTSGGTRTSEMRAEMEEVLRRSGDGLSHGATFRLREQGLSDADIAAERGVSVGTTRGFLHSLDALFEGTLPTTKSAALRNSYVYRELLNHPRSDALDFFIKAKLRDLKEINPDVTFDPLKTRTHQYRVGERKRRRPIAD